MSSLLNLGKNKWNYGRKDSFEYVMEIENFSRWFLSNSTIESPILKFEQAEW